MSAKMTTTYSMWSKFRNCRKACEWRYLKELVPLDRDHNLHFGAAIHECLELWHRHRDLDRVLEHIDTLYPERMGDEKQRADWHLATAMMKAYAARYPEEDFEVVALEKTFEGNIVNPATGASSRSFTLAGKVDGIVKKDGQYFLLEHKTASLVDSGYLERLWGDFQIQLYCWYIEQTLGWRISGIVYNILAKAKLRQKQGEAEDEYQARCAELIAKSKTGKTTAKRKMPETDEEFQARLAEWHAQPDAFHREMLFVSRDQFGHATRRIVGTDPLVSRRAPPRRLLPEHVAVLHLRAALSVLPALPLGRQPQRHRELLPARGAAQRTVRGRRSRKTHFLNREEIHAMPSPTAKTPPKCSLSDVSILLYGPSKIGKSTFASQAPDAIFLATEPGLNALEVYQQPIRNWGEFSGDLRRTRQGRTPVQEPSSSTPSTSSIASAPTTSVRSEGSSMSPTARTARSTA